jgi:hypothetical protein
MSNSQTTKVGRMRTTYNNRIVKHAFHIKSLFSLAVLENISEALLLTGVTGTYFYVLTPKTKPLLYHGKLVSAIWFRTGERKGFALTG